MQRTTLCCSLLLAVVGVAHALSPEDIVDLAFEAMVEDMDENFAYTESRHSSDGYFVARHDPRLPDTQRWVLRSVDDREPSEDEVSDFLEQKELIRANKPDDDSKSIKSIVADGSLALVEETDAHWQFSFRPAADSDDDKAFMESVDGTLLVVKDGHYVSEIRMQNREPIKPGKGVKIEEFRTTMLFAPISPDGPTVPQSIRTAVKGRAMLVISIDENEIVEYSDFETATN